MQGVEYFVTEDQVMTYVKGVVERRVPKLRSPEIVEHEEHLSPQSSDEPIYFLPWYIGLLLST